MRTEIRKILDGVEYELTHGACIVDKNRVAKEICQLFPDEEEIRKRDKRIEELQDTCSIWERLSQSTLDKARNEIAELSRKLDDREADLIQAKREERAGLWEEVVCPLCRIVNRQHKDCHYCQDREDWDALKEGE